MAFDRDKVSKLLSECHRRCCICHRFCGVKMETDHMKPKEDGGSDDIDNAIPLCFECHAEVHAYNVKHPRGRKYTENELTEHKQQWIKICKDHPESLVDNPRMADPGPLSSLFTELEYNQIVSDNSEGTDGLQYRTKQFERAVSEGILSLIDEDLKNKIMDAYIKMSQSNQFTQFLGSYVKTGESREAKNNASVAHRNAKSAIKEAHSKLEEFLNFT